MSLSYVDIDRPAVTDNIIDGDQAYFAGSCCFVNNKEPDNNKFPWIAEIIDIGHDHDHDQRELKIRWLYHPYTLVEAQEQYRGPYELIRTNHEDKITTGMLSGRAWVEKQASGCDTSMIWCWRDTIDLEEEQYLV